MNKIPLFTLTAILAGTTSLGLISGAGSIAPSSAHPLTPPAPAPVVSSGITLTESQPLVVLPSAANVYSTTIFVKNDLPEGKNVRLNMVLRDQFARVQCAQIQRTITSPVPGHSIAPIEFTIVPNDVAAAPLTGVLSLNAESAPGQWVIAATRDVKLGSGLRKNSDVKLVMLPLMLALIVVISCLIRLAIRGLKLSRHMGGASWNFSSSWASNLAIGATLLNSFLSLTLLPEQTHFLPRSTYSALNLFFLTIVAIAPFMYSLITTTELSVNNVGITVQQSQGYVGTFVLAAFLTLWGATGQTIMVALLATELCYSKVVSEPAWIAIASVLVLTTIFMIAYGMRATYQMILLYSVPPRPAVGPVKAIAGAEMPLEKTRTLSSALPNWTVL
jgi:hypothetical protein